MAEHAIESMAENAIEAVLPARAPAGGRPTRKEAARRLERVLSIAQRHFLTSGYGATSVEAIARDAGTAKKTLYHHFGGKAGLFTTVMEALRRSWIVELENLTLMSREPACVLEAVALRLLDAGTRPKMIELHRLFLTEAQRFPELARSCYGKNGEMRGMEPLSDYFRSAVADGSLKIDDIALATEQFTFLVLGGLRGRILLGISQRPSARERRRIAHQAVLIFLAGCQA